jgi:hypothetical protein
MHEQCEHHETPTALTEQEQKWEEARRANETEWAREAQYGNIWRSVAWNMLNAYVHRGATPEAIMQKEALKLNRQYDLEHYD